MSLPTVPWLYDSHTWEPVPLAVAGRYKWICTARHHLREVTDACLHPAWPIQKRGLRGLTGGGEATCIHHATVGLWLAITDTRLEPVDLMANVVSEVEGGEAL